MGKVNTTKNRYIIVDGSLSSHCCFQFTIVDTDAGKKPYGDYWERSMCETFQRDEAEQICAALNKSNQER